MMNWLLTVLCALLVGLWAPACGPSRVTYTASADMLGAYLTPPASRTSCAACPSACPVVRCACRGCLSVPSRMSLPCCIDCACFTVRHASCILKSMSLPSGVIDRVRATLDVMPCSPARHARYEFDLHHICGRMLAFCGVCA